MGITIIPNQPVNFIDLSDPEECKCMGQCFSQLVNKEDETQFQILSSNIVTNGDFETNLNNWNVYESISATVAIINESGTDVCDGEAEITASGGTPGYTYSLDGVTFQSSNVFSGLCSGNYTVIIKDSTGKQGSVEFGITVNVDCGTVGCSESDLFPHDEATLLGCDENDFFCRTAMLLGFDSLSIVADNSSDTITMTWNDNSGTANALAGDAVYLTWHNQTQNYWETGNTGSTRGDEIAIVSDAIMNTGDVIHLYARLINGTLISNPEHIYTIVVA